MNGELIRNPELVVIQVAVEIEILNMFSTVSRTYVSKGFNTELMWPNEARPTNSLRTDSANWGGVVVFASSV